MKSQAEGLVRLWIATADRETVDGPVAHLPHAAANVPHVLTEVLHRSLSISGLRRCAADVNAGMDCL